MATPPRLFTVALTVTRNVAISSAAIAVAVLTACQPAVVDLSGHYDADDVTLGELVYSIMHDNLGGAGSCGEELVLELEAHEAIFVSAFDKIVTDEVLIDLPDLVGGTLLDLIRGGQLQALVGSVREILALPIDDDWDPDRAVLQAGIDLTKTRSVLRADDLLIVVEDVLDRDETQDVIIALAGLALESDGADTVVNSLLDLASRQIENVNEPIECTGLTLPSLRDTLLQTEGFVDRVSYGDATWAVLADDNGNPQVQVDPITGTFYPPYMDVDRDRNADTNADGQPVDVIRSPIRIAPIAPSYGDDALPSGISRDELGRAVAPDGELLFAYVDAKRTVISRVLQLGREILDMGLHDDLFDVVEAALGEQVPCDDGTTTCLHYPSEGNLLADVLFQILELFRFEEMADLVTSLNGLLLEQPDLAEDVLVLGGQLLQTLGTEDISITDGEMLAIVGDLLPLLDRVFETDTASGESTVHLLLDVVQDLGETARQFPADMLLTLDYRALHKDNACSMEPPDLDRSTPVDYGQPRYFTSAGDTVDNRSNFEQTVELLAAVDCGRVPFTGGQTVGVTVLDIISGLQPDTVCTVVDVLLGLLDLLPGVGEFFTVQALNLIGCNGQQVFDLLDSLDGLAKSGALDMYIPLARVFADQDQLRTLIDIFHVLVADLHLDDDTDPATTSTLRRAIPILADVLRSGAADTIFDLLDELMRIRGENGRILAETLVDALALLVDDDQPVTTRAGVVTGTSHVTVILDQVLTLIDSLEQAEGVAPLQNILDYMGSFLTDTVVDDQGTVDPTDDRIVLADQNFMPLTQLLIQVAAEAFSVSADTRMCYLDTVQEGAVSLLTDRDFATLARIFEVLDTSADGQTLESYLMDFITPDGGGAEDLYGVTMRIATAMLQIRADSDALGEILRYVAAVLDPNTIDAQLIVTTLAEVLESEGAGAFWVLLQNAVDRGPNGGSEPPLLSFVGIISDMMEVGERSECSDVPAEFGVEEIEKILQGIIDFMDDDEAGLGAIFELIELVAEENAVEENSAETDADVSEDAGQDDVAEESAE